ncbi:MAG TPA: hypothetical protein VGE13_00430 [Candidatus Saccharimonadales bacterium]
MTERFADILTEGGKKNTLGRAEEVLQIVANDHSRLEELYRCLFEDDAWVRMRAVDTLEKICRVHPDWLDPYIERLLSEVAAIDQASVQWHLAQMFGRISLSPDQRRRAIKIMERNISSKEADWIVASNTMDTLAKFVADGILPASELAPLLKIQQSHHSNAVVKRATRILQELPG